MTVHTPGLAGRPDARFTSFLPVLTPLLASLTDAELDGIAAALGPRWCMARHQDPGGQVMAVVMAAEDDPALPAWVVHREGALLHLDLCQGDSYVRHGTYAALPPLLASLHAALAAAGR